MIKINIVAVGKVKESYFRDAIDEYVKRLSRFATVDIKEVKEETFLQGQSSVERQKLIDAEGESILQKLKGKVISLCIEGEKLSSENFARLLKKYIDDGEEITFVIGGSYGLSDKVKNASAKRLSFSDMTFPHTMARLVLTEQIYRAFTIINNAVYHK